MQTEPSGFASGHNYRFGTSGVSGQRLRCSPSGRGVVGDESIAPFAPGEARGSTKKKPPLPQWGSGAEFDGAHHRKERFAALLAVFRQFREWCGWWR